MAEELDTVLAELQRIGAEGKTLFSILTFLVKYAGDISFASAHRRMKCNTKMGFVNFDLPLNHGRAPSQPRPEREQQNQVPALDTPTGDRLIQGDSHRRRRGVAVFV